MIDRKNPSLALELSVFETNHNQQFLNENYTHVGTFLKGSEIIWAWKLKVRK